MNKFFHVYGLIIPFMTGIQSAVGSTVPGATKKQWVLNLLDGAAGVGETMPSPVVEEFSFLIDLVAHTLFGSPAPAPKGTPSATPVVAPTPLTA